MRDVERHISRDSGESHRSGSRSDLWLWRRIYVETAGYRLAAFALLMIEFVATPLFLLSPIPLAIVVDSVLGDKPLPSPVDAIVPDSITPTQLLVFAAALQIGVVLLTDLQALSQNVLRAWIQEKLSLRMRSQLLIHVQRLSFAFHDRRGTADSLYRIQYDSTALGSMIVTNLLPLFSALFTLVSVFVVIVGINAELALIALATTPFLAVLSRRSKKQMRRHYRESKRLESSAMGVVHEVLGNVRVVKAFGREDSEHRRFLRWGDASARKRVGIAARESRLDLAINLITAAGTGLVLFVGAQSVLSGVITLGALLIVINYLARLYTPLKTLTRRVTGMQNAYESLQRAFELLDQEPDVAERVDALPVQRARGDIEFEEVSFAYEGEPPVLSDVSVRIPPGTRLGIVGRTGAGKTTLVSLLMRFYDVSSGVIRLDGKDVRDLRIADLRNQFAIVLQEPVLFSTSIADNIRYGKADATQDQVRQAADAAGIAEFIKRLPEGYDTMVGERGQRLSGGERQRIALARAFLKDAPILVLDEPTSAVDVATEASIMKAMESLAHGRTTFMIAHRLSTLEKCDMIVRVEDGTCSVVDQHSNYERTALSGTASTPALRPSLSHSRPETVPGTSSANGDEALMLWAGVGGGRQATAVKRKKQDTSAFRLYPERGPGDGVIARRGRTERIEREARLYDRVIPHELTVRCLGSAPSVQKPAHSWIFLEDAGERGLKLSNPEHRHWAASWLARLHSVDASILDIADLDQLSLDGRLGHFPRVVSEFESMSNSSSGWFIELMDDLLQRFRAVERLVPLAVDRAMSAPIVLAHGDFQDKNLRLIDDRIVAFDWETLALTTPAVDLARLFPVQNLFPDTSAAGRETAERYMTGVKDKWPGLDFDTLMDCALVGTWLNLVQAVDWLMQGRSWNPERTIRAAESYLKWVDALSGRLEEARRRTVWRAERCS
jgi:ATP-binding cassette, subfamily B, bacterial